MNHVPAPTDAGTATVIALNGVGVSAARGQVFGPVTATVTSPVTMLLGGRGTGRTSALLTLCGRMRPNEGTLSVLGEQRMAKIRKRTGIVGFDQIDALEENVTLADTLRERMAWASAWYRHIPKITEELAYEILSPAFGTAGTGIPIPSAKSYIYELTPAQEMLTRIALALLESPEMLLIDDFDALRDPNERVLVAQRISALINRGLTVVVASSDHSDAELLARAGHTPAVIRLSSAHRRTDNTVLTKTGN